MSTIFQQTCVCDLCGAELISDRRVFGTGQPPVVRALSRVEFGYGAVYDLCRECAAPCHEAFQKRIEQLRMDDKLKRRAI